MNNYKVTFDLQVPADIEYTEDELMAWLRFELHNNGYLRGENPFLHETIEARNIRAEKRL
jgi:hypothetical protein